MAVTVTPLLTTVDAALSTTGWTADGEWGGLNTDDAIFREGGGSLRGQISEAAGHLYHTLGAVDLTAAANRRVYAWILPPGSFDTFANGGLRIVLGDDTNRIAYYVGGNDVNQFQVGAWSCVTLDANNVPTNFEVLAGSEGSLDLTAITEIGVGINNPAKAVGSSPNSWCDIITYGTGLRITGGGSGTEGNFAELAADDTDTANAYGIIREIQAGVYGIQGDLIFGDGPGSGSIDFLDDDVVVLVEDNVKGTGTNTDISINGAHNATGSFSVELGLAVGSGDTQNGRSGLLFINTNALQSVNFDWSDADAETLLLYGCSMTRMTGTVAFSADATNGPNHKLSGCTFAECGQVGMGRVVGRNLTFAGHDGVDSAVLWNADIDIKNSQFLANTDSTNDPAAIEHTVAGTFGYNNLQFADNDFDIRNSINAATADSYPDSNQDSSQKLGDATTVGVGQSFTNVTSGKLSNARFDLSKTGSPTGNLVAKLYALASAIGGGDDVPTGAALATSDPVSAAGLTGTLVVTQFNFSDNITMAATTDYFIAVEEDAGYSGGASDNVNVGTDTSSPTHTGNMATDDGSDPACFLHFSRKLRRANCLVKLGGSDTAFG